MTISIGANDIRERSLQGGVGGHAYADQDDVLVTLINKDPQAKAIKTLTVDSYSASGVYAFSINGFELSYTEDSDVDASGVAAKLAALINGDINVRGQVAAAAVGAVVTLTGNYPGISFTLSESDAKLSTADVQAAAEAEAIEFGLLCCSVAHLDNNRLGFKAKAGKLSAQQDTLTVTYAAGEEYMVQITVEGETYLAKVDADTDDATTASALADAINGMLPANSVLATPAAGVVTLDAELAGKAFKVAKGTKLDAANLALAHVVAGPATDLNKAAIGIALRSYDQEGNSYPGNAGVKAKKKGAVWVENAQAPAQGDPVYVELDGDDAGKFFNTSSSTRVLLEKAEWEYSARAATDGIAILKVDL
jgi:phage tail sheath gpL-like